MTEPIRRPVSQLRAGDLIAPGDGGTVYVVCAISSPVGTSRRAELVDARTGEAGHCVLLPLHEAVLTVPGSAQWVVVTDRADGSVETFLAAEEFRVPESDTHAYESWEPAIDLLGRPGWEELRRGARRISSAEAA